MSTGGVRRGSSRSGGAVEGRGRKGILGGSRSSPWGRKKEKNLQRVWLLARNPPGWRRHRREGGGGRVEIGARGIVGDHRVSQAKIGVKIQCGPGGVVCGEIVTRLEGADLTGGSSLGGQGGQIWLVVRGERAWVVGPRGGAPGSSRRLVVQRGAPGSCIISLKYKQQLNC
ncbi:hypothetical protein TIFTF001_014970 [Ficus carica]|uniref:Uncharacterized protein n=1 Tax=Ficus carica TaxID=3494 RepID=A0AA88AGZ6_FICCA|nr:hypothetical protein TIFTF001_014970 [Ficus carica]